MKYAKLWELQRKGKIEKRAKKSLEISTTILNTQSDKVPLSKNILVEKSGHKNNYSIDINDDINSDINSTRSSDRNDTSL